MNQKIDFLNDVSGIFKDTLGRNDLELELGTSPADIEEWDSFNHIQLVVNVEGHFDIKFSVADIERFRSVGDLIELIKSKLLEKNKSA